MSHRSTPGAITLEKTPVIGLSAENVEQYSERHGPMEYLVIYEESAEGWGAYSPDLPGLRAAGKTLEEVKELIRHTMEFYLAGMRREGERIPVPSVPTAIMTVDIHA
jgi:predicted RNase H-like HicB family nuclease